MTRILPPVQPERGLLAPVLQFLRIEAASGVLLLSATVLALLWANSPWSASYFALWHTAVVPAFGRPDLLFLVNDGLMTAFFLLVGLELRRELHEGALADLKVASLPLLAALGGVTVPALIYLLLAPGAPRGWAVPTTTDIAFAVGVLSLAIRRAPRGLRVLLLTLSIADDIAAVVIIAAFYTAHIDPLGVLIAAGAGGAQAALQRAGRGGIVTYSVAGIAIWSALLESGVHPTLAGVALGLITPVTAGTAPVKGLPHSGRAVRMEAALHPWVAYLILPLFALANAGVDVRGLKPGDLQWQVAAGIIAGLVLGKPLGILLASGVAVRSGLSTVPAGVRPPHLVVFGCLAGIGFTMSMFLCTLAFTDPTLLATAKAAVLVASALAATLGMCLGRLLAGPRSAPASGTPPVKKGH